MRLVKPSLVVAGALAAMPAARAQPVTPFALRLDPQLSEQRAAVREQRPSFARAGRIEGRADRETTLTGDAELRRPGTVIRADRITYYEEDDQVVAAGRVRVVRDGNVFTGPELVLRIDTNEGFFSSPSYTLPVYGGRGRAGRIEFLGQGRLRLFDALYTTCRPDRPDWWLQAEQIEIDEVEQVGRGQRARLVFKQRALPVLPLFSFPLGDERRTGFLPPTLYLTSRTGVEIVAPFYWNIAPNRDLTLYPRLFARRGVQLGGEFRYLEPRSFGAARFEVLPGDRQPTGQSPGATRYFYGLDHSYLNVAGWSGRVVARRVSDDNYFTDFGRTLLAASERSLPLDLSAVRGIGGGWVLAMGATRWQNILDARASPPYDRLPTLQLATDRRDVGGFDIAARLEATQFSRALSPTPEGWRFIANPSVSYPFTAPGWFVVPRASLHATQYSLSANPATPGDPASALNPTSLSRVLPTVSVDAGLVFERPVALRGRAFTQTLEPRLFYVRTPYRDQSQFPVFDSGLASFNFAQLFAENRFVGGDRIADVNQLTTAAVTRLIDPAGREMLRLALGQRLSFTEQRVALPGQAPPSDRRSDLLLAGTLDAGASSYVDVGVQYALRDRSVPRANVAWRYWPAPDRLVNVGYRFTRDLVSQFDTSWRWPVSDKWTTMGRLNWSFLRRTIDPSTGLSIESRPGIIESVLGMEYRADCYVFRLALQRYVTVQSATGTVSARPNNVLFFQLELNGVGRIGNDLSDILRRNIPGYRFAGGRPEAPSRFFGYE